MGSGVWWGVESMMGVGSEECDGEWGCDGE